MADTNLSNACKSVPTIEFRSDCMSVGPAPPPGPGLLPPFTFRPNRWVNCNSIKTFLCYFVYWFIPSVSLHTPTTVSIAIFRVFQPANWVANEGKIRQEKYGKKGKMLFLKSKSRKYLTQFNTAFLPFLFFISVGLRFSFIRSFGGFVSFASCFCKRNQIEIDEDKYDQK